MIFLETDRLIFRTHEPQDEDGFVAMQTDPEVRRYVGGQAWPEEMARTRFRNEYLGLPKKTYGVWATILKAEARYVGRCGLRASAGKKEAYLAFFIVRAYWRRGFASEAAKAFIDAGFSRLKLNRILAQVDHRNEVSEHILQKFRFKYLSREEYAASGRVILLYELSKTEWKSRAS